MGYDRKRLANTGKENQGYRKKDVGGMEFLFFLQIQSNQVSISLLGFLDYSSVFERSKTAG